MQKAEAKFAIVKIKTSVIKICFSGLVLPIITSNIEPNTTPSAYIEIKFPAIGIEQLIDFAVSGKIPIITYSVNPSPNVPNARGKRQFALRIFIFL